MNGFEQLIVLGTGNAMVTKCFNTCFALQKGEKYLLVDTGGGNGILAALEKANIDAKKIDSLFITHSHTDHILGFPWVVRKIGALMNSGEYEGSFVVYGHSEALAAARTICELTVQNKFTKLFDDKIIFKTVADGEKLSVMGEEIEVFDIHSTKLKQFGFKTSAAGDKTLVCLGDEPCDKDCENIAQDADWLLCEAFCLYEDRERFKPYEKHHSTALDAAQLAEHLNIKKLVLWHTEDKTISQRKQRCRKDVKLWAKAIRYLMKEVPSVGIFTFMCEEDPRC